MIADVRERDGIPVLLTPVQRLFFRSNGEPLRTHKDYPAAMRDVAAQTGTLLIDTEELSWQWLKELGSVEAAAPYFVLDKRGNTEHPDRSHLTREGALVVAGWVAEGLRAGGLWPAAR